MTSFLTDDWKRTRAHGGLTWPLKHLWGDRPTSNAPDLKRPTSSLGEKVEPLRRSLSMRMRVWYLEPRVGDEPCAVAEVGRVMLNHALRLGLAQVLVWGGEAPGRQHDGGAL